MNLKESLKKDWRVDIGLLFFCIFLTSIFVAIANHNPILILVVYILLVIASAFLEVASEYLGLFIFPLFPIAFWVQNEEQKKIKKHLSNFNQNIPASAVVILAHYDRYHVKYGMKPNYDFVNIKAIVEYLKETRVNDFSFYTEALRSDVELIMSNQKVKEVLFVGHGDSHLFVLSLDEDIYYCDFNNPKYAKDFVHQVHCGDKSGKNRRLIDYVVREENRGKCFYFEKTIRTKQITKWFKERTKELG